MKQLLRQKQNLPKGKCLRREAREFAGGNYHSPFPPLDNIQVAKCSSKFQARWIKLARVFSYSLPTFLHGRLGKPNR